MIRIFRAVIKRDWENKNDDPIFCNFNMRDVLDPLKTKVNLDRIKKFQINRNNYVALGLITDLEDINEDDLKINITYLKTSHEVSFKEHLYYPTKSDEISSLSRITFITGNDIGNLIFSAIESNIGTDDNNWDLYILKDEYDNNKELINTILNSELNYGRKRKKFII